MAQGKVTRNSNEFQHFSPFWMKRGKIIKEWMMNVPSRRTFSNFFLVPSALSTPLHSRRFQFSKFNLNIFHSMHSTIQRLKTIKIQLKFRKRRISSWVSRDPVHRILPSNWIKWNEKLIKSVCCWNSILHTPRSTTYICKWITKIQFKSSRDENHFIYFFKNPQTWACDERCNSFFRSHRVAPSHDQTK